MEEINKELLIKKPKKILAKILIIFLAVIGLSLISLNYININLTRDFNKTEIDSIIMYRNGKSSSEFWNDIQKTTFDEILNKVSDSLQVDTLAHSFFSGKLFSSEKISSYNQSNAISGIAKKSSESKYIQFNYSSEQNIKVNNQVYTSDELSKSSKTYNKLLIEINNSSTPKESKIYFINSNGYSYYYITLSTTGNQLNDYIENYFD